MTGATLDSNDEPYLTLFDIAFGTFAESIILVIVCTAFDTTPSITHAVFGEV